MIDGDECLGSLNVGDLQNVARFFPFYNEAMSLHSSFPSFVRHVALRYGNWAVFKYTPAQLKTLCLSQTQYNGYRVVSKRLMESRLYMVGDHWRELIRRRAFYELESLIVAGIQRKEIVVAGRHVRIVSGTRDALHRSRSYLTLHTASILRVFHTASLQRHPETGEAVFAVLCHRLHPLALYPTVPDGLGVTTAGEFDFVPFPDSAARDLDEEVEEVLTTTTTTTSPGGGGGGDRGGAPKGGTEVV